MRMGRGRALVGCLLCGGAVLLPSCTESPPVPREESSLASKQQPASSSFVERAIPLRFIRFYNWSDATNDPPALYRWPRNYFLNWAAHQEPSQLVVWLHENTGGPHGLLPWAGPATIHLNGPEANGGARRWLLSHEIGHTLGGFSHADDWLRNVVPDQYAYNPRTEQRWKACDAWDVMHRKLANGIEVYDTRDDACLQEPNIQPIYNPSEPGGNWSVDACGVLSGCPSDSNGVPHCFAVPDPELKGLGATLGTTCSGGQHSHTENIMMMRQTIPDGYGMLNESQIQRLRSYLRYETEIRDNRWSGLAGEPHNRTRLGRYANREPAYLLDFDADGKRDIAWWEPPTTPGTLGTFRVLLSSYSFTTDSSYSMTVSFGLLGDVPVPADYDGDGQTDLAVYRPGGGLSGTDLEDSIGRWSYCTTSSNPLLTTCTLALYAEFGSRGDTPLPGLDFDGDGKHELTLYRPSAGEYKWASVPMPSTVTVRGLGGAGEVPLPGLYDSDDKADLVTYDPDTATFRMRLSTSCFLGSCWWSFVERPFDIYGGYGLVAQPGTAASDRSGAFPVRGMKHGVQTGFVYQQGQWVPKYEPRLAFAVYSPHDFRWHVAWDPLNSSYVTRCVFGDDHAVPFGGIDSASGWSTVVTYGKMAYYSSDDATGPGYVNFKAASPGSCTGTESVVWWTSWSPKKMVYPVHDMFTDGKPEIILVDPHTGDAKYMKSENGYTVQYAIELGNQLSVIL